MEITAQRLAANRRNAELSTGPRTPDGKAAASQNARKHGLLARDPVITAGDGAENPFEYDELLKDLYAEFTPQTRIEHALVERIAAGLWRLRRAQRHEVGAIRQTLDECGREDAESYDQKLKKLNAQLEDQAAMLESDTRFVAYLATGPDPSSPKVLKSLREEARKSNVDVSKLDPAATLAAVAAMFDEDIKHHHKILAKLHAEIESVQRYRQLHLDRRPLIASLPPDANLIGLLRYETMIDRQIHRALAELRRRHSHDLRHTLGPRRHHPLPPEKAPSCS